MDLSFDLAPSYRELKHPTSRQNFDDTLKQKSKVDLRPCQMMLVHPRTYVKTFNQSSILSKFSKASQLWMVAKKMTFDVSLIRHSDPTFCQLT